ncbi:hypothetical protein GIB67_031856 [Kingdonia uniflora]|uniref:SWIM-type domain-containing protein n=1 Tax=Kingdonia uniflora TaxID=39325 RepID=A0A7J7L4P7_9MAGN|nr:hypothetical protein GIB67_031856 [Kingdonia uniflora]
MILRGRNFDHSSSGKLDYGNRLANAQWVANDCEEMVRDVKIVTSTDIITRIRRAYGVNISYYTAWNAKIICVERITGCFDERYSIKQELCRQVLLSNPGSIAKCGCDPHTKMWIGTCIAFKASLDGFVQGCRPILRDKPLHKFIKGINLMMMKLTYDRRKKKKNWNVNSVVPRAKTHIEEMKKCYNQYTPQGADANKWVTISKDGKKLRVDLVGKTCDCYEWKISGLPCVHALYVIMEMRMDWVGFCSEYHMVATYRRSYKGSVLPISDPSLWEKPNGDMLPPPLERGTGRPRKVRRRSIDENTTQQQQKCGKCRFFGHNKKTCKGPPAAPGPRNLQPTTRTDRRGGRPRGSRPRNNPPTRIGVGIGVGVGVGMRGRGTRGGVARGGAARGNVAGGGAARARQQSTYNPRGGVNNARGGLTGGGATRVHTQASQQSKNNPRGRLTRGGAARVHTQASQQSTNNARGGLTRG